MSEQTYLPPVYHSKSQAEHRRVLEWLCACGKGYRECTSELRIELARPAPLVDSDLFKAAADALECLKRLPDVEGAFRVTCIQQLRLALRGVLESLDCTVQRPPRDWENLLDVYQNTEAKP